MHLNGLGPDPMVDKGKKAEQRFVDNVRKRAVAIGLLLMDQSVVAGIGNVYRAELLFRARIDPHTPGNRLTEDQTRALWRDWVKLMRIGGRDRADVHHRPGARQAVLGVPAHR